MLGRKWTAAEKTAYRSAFTVGRIVDEVWIVIGIVSFFLFVAFVIGSGGLGIFAATFYILGFLALGLVAYRFLPGFLKPTMPADLRSSLPEGRFDGASSPTAPRTYRELFRRWLRRQ